MINYHQYSRCITGARVFEDNPSQFRDLIVLLAGGEANQTKKLAYQTSWGAVSNCIQCDITENPDSIWEMLKPELSARFVEVCDPHHALSLLHKARESKSETVIFYAERLCTLVCYAFVKLNKAVVEIKFVGFSIDGL